MKKIYLVVATFFVAFAVSGQSERMILVEHATQASCPPCATYNPTLNALLANNDEDVVSIKYQTSWPGVDPMNADNPTEVANRVSYYSITGVPNGVVNGGNAQSVPSITQSTLNTALAQDALFDIDIDYTLLPDGINIDVSTVCTEAVSGNLKLRIAVVEREILWNSPPGTNGEDEFFDVMKKFLPGADGLVMTAESKELGGVFTTSQSWEYGNIYDYGELAVVAWIQDDNNRAVHQAARAQGEVLAPVNAFDVRGTNITDIANEDCEGILTPTVTIRNNGESTLTSADLEYDLNGVAGTIQWAGNLEFFETEEVELEEITFPLTGQGYDYNLAVTVSNPNGQVDENPDNDIIIATPFVAGVVDELDIELHFYTDAWASESTWQLRNSSNQTVANGGPYQAGPGGGAGGPDANTTIVHDITLPDAQDCYELRVFDSWGDGLLLGPSEGPDGKFGVEFFQNGTSIKFVELGGDMGTSEIIDGALVATAPLSIDNNTLADFNVFPNPSTGLINLEFSLIASEEVRIALFDVTGKQILNNNFGDLPKGYFFNQLDLSSFDNGIYLMNIMTGDNQTTSRVVINK